MTDFVDTFGASLAAVVSAAGRVVSQSAAARELSAKALIAAQGDIAGARRDLDASAAVIAGQIALRSRPEAGHAGLAQREGFRTPEALVQHATGSTAREAMTLVRVGAMIHDSTANETGAPTYPVAEPWLVPVGLAVASGTLSVAAAEAIRGGLGGPNEDVSIDALRDAAATLVRLGPTLNADQMFRRAREARDDLDEAGIAIRERERRELRSLRRWRKPDGMTRYIWELDPESAALVDGIYDQLTSLRRGGPRMVDKAEQKRAEAVERDPRTTDQLASDGFLDLLTIAVGTVTGTAVGISTGTDPRQLIGIRNPAVRVLVSAEHLAAGNLAGRTGHGRIEGHPDPISIETVERIACTSGIIPIHFDTSGQVLDVGREQRLFTRRQRIGLAARDGGCRWPECQRPPGWTEAHHVDHWQRDHGETSIDNGILLCRHHHLLLHDNHWEIAKRGAEYWLIPPPGIDPDQTARPMPSKSPALHDLLDSRSA
ncbi:MAG: endonuclease [Microbacteriaceae bacterium]|nr:endonuclease [Microbacteriaceae bacterium]